MRVARMSVANSVAMFSASHPDLASLIRANDNRDMR
jgi:hypothetical protein